MKKLFIASHPLKLAAIIWLLFALDVLWPGSFNQYGIYPRQLPGLAGILIAPWLHLDLLHIASNTLPLLILGSLLQAYGSRVFIWVSVITALVSGLGVWLFSAPGITVGASGVVYGYWGFLLAAGFIHRSLKSIAIAVVVGLLYSALLLSLFSVDSGVSWSAHFFGVVGGVLSVFVLKKSWVSQ